MFLGCLCTFCLLVLNGKNFGPTKFSNYRGPKSTKKQELFDHIAETFHYLRSKYGAGLEFIIAGDTNRLNLSPITDLSPDIQQVVKIPTRLNPDRILDPIITTMKKYYCAPVTKPPVNPDSEQSGKPN